MNKGSRYFGVMLDMSRNAVMKPQQVKEFASLIRKMGYNMLQLYTEDTYEVENEPYFGYMRGRYTQAELKDIVAYCEGIGVEVIPCIQTLAHLAQIFRWKPYCELRDFADILLVGEDRTYELIENMFKTLRKCFSTQYVHIGMDEAHMLGLGKYLDKHGIENRFEILQKHLSRVVKIAEKYDFKPIMWSDMFFRLANNGEYYPEEPRLTEEVVKMLPKDLGLVYWDYYHTEKEYMAKMMRAHLQSGNDAWFAGGAWTWTGFACGNKYTLETMLPAMEAAAECGVENIFITLWGDDGKECSYYSVLPSLFAIKKAYDGVTDEKIIRKEFKEIVGVEYDAMMALDTPNYVDGNEDCKKNICKRMLYNDPFTGVLDTLVKQGVPDEYAAHAKRLRSYATGKYAYLFENAAALCELLSMKYGLGKRTREAYKSKNADTMSALIEDYKKTEGYLDAFYEAFCKLWFTENKAQGFEVQDLRLGGLKQRLAHCRKRLTEYMEGKIENIPELEEELLDYFGNGKEFTEEPAPTCLSWWRSALVHVL